MKRYFIGITFLASALLLSGCSEKEGGDDSGAGTPSTRSVAEIQFVSRLDEGSLIKTSSDYNALNDYMVNTLKGKEKASLTVLDRMDGANVTNMMQLSVNTYRWNTFALNGASSAVEGSAVYFNDPSSSISSVPSGDGAYVCGLTPTVAGFFQKLDAEGNITSSNSVTSDVNFYTVRLATEEQVNAFGGTSGAMMTIRQINRNMLLIGTVKSSLYDKLVSTVSSTDSAYGVKEVVKGAAYTLFIVSSDRFWNYYGYEETSLGGGIVSYSINVGWK